ncbi:hypothetical protein MJG53_019024 [Ovis ammon polii x Ovis aries]|uniref:Uncharacterized protein n=1 Tax=Ovis ammon polii x Ovis aries TaxID=2918886 RepID=A0ACB9U436_9CETA|nr:hypothetical protein MJG53_019024 [Ovis ammon polii x Ovis aries]
MQQGVAPAVCNDEKRPCAAVKTQQGKRTKTKTQLLPSPEFQRFPGHHEDRETRRFNQGQVQMAESDLEQHGCAWRHYGTHVGEAVLQKTTVQSMIISVKAYVAKANLESKGLEREETAHVIPKGKENQAVAQLHRLLTDFLISWQSDSQKKERQQRSDLLAQEPQLLKPEGRGPVLHNERTPSSHVAARSSPSSLHPEKNLHIKEDPAQPNANQ